MTIIPRAQPLSLPSAFCIFHCALCIVRFRECPTPCIPLSMPHRHPSGSPFFMFATGIENSAPTIKHGAHRVDEMERCGHYARWREDFELVRELGIRFLRYGVPLHRAYVGPERFDWAFADQTLGSLREMDIVPIADLCHFGVPDWIGNFQNPDFPDLFAAYARAFACRYPWIQLYTPVNEMLICAVFSAKFGWWNEQG